MSHYPEFAIFRNFNTLRLQNLLYLQAELTQLETRLQEASEKNGNSVVQHEQWAARDWQHLSRADPISGEPNKQWEIFLLIREKLKEYGE